jgi:hypothetical protein
MAEIGLSEQPWRQEIAYVETLQNESNPALLNLIYGLRLFAAHKDQSWNRFNEHFKDTTVKADLIGRLQKALGQLEDGRQPAGDDQLFDALGFGFGFPSLVSSAMGVLDTLNALSREAETTCKRALLSHMKNGYWISTFDSAQVIFNTRGILNREAIAFAKEREAKTRKVLARNNEGKALGELTRIPSGFIGTFTDAGPPALLSRIHVEGLGPAEFASSSIAANVPYQAIETTSNGVTVSRKFMRVTPSGHETLDPAQPLRQGDIVISEISLKRGPRQGAGSVQSRFLVVEDGIPSLAEAVDDDRTYLADAKIQADDNDYWAAVKETRRYPERTVRIAKVEPDGEMKIYQVWRAAFKGMATVPPARAFDMYDESIRGNTKAQGLRVE